MRWKIEKFDGANLKGTWEREGEKEEIQMLLKCLVSQHLSDAVILSSAGRDFLRVHENHGKEGKFMLECGRGVAFFYLAHRLES